MEAGIGASIAAWLAATFSTAGPAAGGGAGVGAGVGAGTVPVATTVGGAVVTTGEVVATTAPVLATAGEVAVTAAPIVGTTGEVVATAAPPLLAAAGEAAPGAIAGEVLPILAPVGEVLGPIGGGVVAESAPGFLQSLLTIENAFMLASLTGSSASTGTQVESQKALYKAEEAAARNRAKVAEAEGDLDAANRHRAAAAAISSLLADLGSSGIAIEGSPLLALSNTASEYGRSIAASRASGLATSDLELRRARSAARAGKSGQVAAGLAGGTEIIRNVGDQYLRVTRTA